ncbi:MAG TPA: glycosyltransferase [Burkholderiales bacterium]|nr:glycosyltransferase [Burkholderiales bacterium]
MTRQAAWLSRLSRLLHGLYLACPVWLTAPLRLAAPVRWRSLVRRRFVPLLDPHTAPLALRRAQADTPADAADVCLFGPWHAVFGIGEAARATAHACRAAGLKIELYELRMRGLHPHLDAELEPLLTQLPRAQVQVFCCNADTMMGLGPVHCRAAWPGRYRIGTWFWELERFPRAWLSALDEVDELWAASPHIQAMLAAETDKPVIYMSPAVDFELARAYTRREFGLAEEAFLCLFSYDFSAAMERKNPRACIAAFRRAFPQGGEDAMLVIKTLYAERDPESWAALQALAREDGRIVLRDEALARADFYGLLSVCDVYLSLHRAEGLGLGMAEAMRLGKPVVATGYSGNLAFMNADNSCLVDYARMAVAPGAYAHAEGQSWAEPDIDHAARHLRRLHEDRPFGAALGARAAAHMREHHSLAAAGACVGARLAQLRGCR